MVLSLSIELYRYQEKLVKFIDPNSGQIKTSLNLRRCPTDAKPPDHIMALRNVKRSYLIWSSWIKIKLHTFSGVHREESNWKKKLKQNGWNMKLKQNNKTNEMKFWNKNTKATNLGMKAVGWRNLEMKNHILETKNH